jgi:cytochrome c553
MRTALFALIALTALAACGEKSEVAPDAAPQTSAPQPLETPAVSAAPAVNPGKLRYVAVCQGCHGLNGEGQGPFAKLAGRPAEELAKLLRDYRAGTPVGPQSATMMPFAKALTDADIDAIAEYLAGL